MLDATYIANRVWMGGRPPIGPEVGNAGFTLLLICAQELVPAYQQAGPDAFPGVQVMFCPFDDADLNNETMRNIASWVLAIDFHLRANPKNKVLVTCNAGMNRSGLVVADYLNWAMGVSGREAIEMVRRRRNPFVEGGALSNSSFVAALRALPRVNKQRKVAQQMGKM